MQAKTFWPAKGDADAAPSDALTALQHQVQRAGRILGHRAFALGVRAHRGCRTTGVPAGVHCFGGTFTLQLEPGENAPSPGWLRVTLRGAGPLGELTLSARGDGLPPHSLHTPMQRVREHTYAADYFLAPGTKQLLLLGRARAGAELRVQQVVVREQGSHEARVRQRVANWTTTARDVQLVRRKASALAGPLRRRDWPRIARALRGGRDHLTQPRHYDAWVATHDALSAADVDAMQADMEAMAARSAPVGFSVVVPCYNTPADLLAECIDSVERQIYPHWQLCLANDASTEPHVAEMLDAAAARDPRIQVVHRPTNGHIARASNDALALAQKEWVALLDHDDVLAPHALYMVAKAIAQTPEAGLVYSDEDKLDQDGRRCDPYFKPSFNADLLRGQNYISHLGVYRRDIVTRVGGFRPAFNGSQDYDLVLRVTEQLRPDQVVHVPHVLYHWRMTPGSAALGPESKPYAYVAAELALQEHLERTQRKARVRPSLYPGQFHVKYAIGPHLPKVSIVIPTRDNVPVLDRCLETLRATTHYPNYEIVVVDNDSATEQSRRYMAQLAKKPGVKCLHYDHPFNYAAINNWAVAQTDGEVVVLLNDDVEIIEADWLEELVGQALRPEIGAVGAKLLFPNRTVQHAGVVLGMGGVAAHVFRGIPAGEPGYFCRALLAHNVTAVTAAALAIRRSTFDEVGGFNERLAVAYNDVDFCLRLYCAGYDNLFTPHARLVHHESVSRGADSFDGRPGFRDEWRWMDRHWRALIADDPNYNCNLTLSHTDYGTAESPRRATRLALRPKFDRQRRPAGPEKAAGAVDVVVEARDVTAARPHGRGRRGRRGRHHTQPERPNGSTPGPS